jgi:hypothetical protein
MFGARICAASNAGPWSWFGSIAENVKLQTHFANLPRTVDRSAAVALTNTVEIDRILRGWYRRNHSDRALINARRAVAAQSLMQGDLCY